MNVTFTSLSLNLMTKPFFITGNKNFKMINSHLSFSSNLLFYNIKNLKLQNDKFSHFLSKAIQSEKKLFTFTGPYFTSSSLTEFSSVKIQDCIFYQCSTVLTSENEDQTIEINSTSFIECSQSLFNFNIIKSCLINRVCVNSFYRSFSTSSNIFTKSSTDNEQNSDIYGYVEMNNSIIYSRYTLSPYFLQIQTNEFCYSSNNKSYPAIQRFLSIQSDISIYYTYNTDAGSTYPLQISAAKKSSTFSSSYFGPSDEVITFTCTGFHTFSNFMIDFMTMSFSVTQGKLILEDCSFQAKSGFLFTSNVEILAHTWNITTPNYDQLQTLACEMQWARGPNPYPNIELPEYQQTNSIDLQFILTLVFFIVILLIIIIFMVIFGYIQFCRKSRVKNFNHFKPSYGEEIKWMQVWDIINSKQNGEFAEIIVEDAIIEDPLQHIQHEYEQKKKINNKVEHNRQVMREESATTSQQGHKINKFIKKHDDQPSDTSNTSTTKLVSDHGKKKKPKQKKVQEPEVIIPQPIPEPPAPKEEEESSDSSLAGNNDLFKNTVIVAPAKKKVFTFSSSSGSDTGEVLFSNDSSDSPEVQDKNPLFSSSSSSD